MSIYRILTRQHGVGPTLFGFSQFFSLAPTCSKSQVTEVRLSARLRINCENVDHNEDQQLDKDSIARKYQRTHPSTELGCNWLGLATIPRPLINSLMEIIGGWFENCSCCILICLGCDERRLHKIQKNLEHSVTESNSRAEFFSDDIRMAKTAQNFNDYETLAWSISLFPYFYGPMYSIVTECFKRLGANWVPENVLDVGSNLGIGALALKEVILNNFSKLQNQNNDVFSVAFNQVIPISITVVPGGRSFSQLSEKFHHATLTNTYPFSSTTMATKILPMDYVAGQYDLVFGSYFSQLHKAQHVRDDYIFELWNKVTPNLGVLILLEKGDAQGFEHIARARELLLRSEATDTSLRIVAPCPHHLACPMSPNPIVSHTGRRDWCHFFQNTQFPEFFPHSKNKPLILQEKNVPYSYIIFQKGTRRPDTMTDETLNAIYHWPRVISRPQKSKGFVNLDTCSASGNLEIVTVPKSQGKQDYHDARKTRWGDIWALGSKKAPRKREARQGIPCDEKYIKVPRTRMRKKANICAEDIDEVLP